MSHEPEGGAHSHEHTDIHTPEVKRSGVIGIIVAIVLLVILLIVITKALKNDPKNSVTPEQGETEVALNFDYNLLDVNYGDYVSFSINPGETKTIELTNDYCPGWSSGQINVFLSNGNKIILCGNKILQGKNYPSTYYKFVNSYSGKTITIKVARCESKNNCNVNF